MKLEAIHQMRIEAVQGMQESGQRLMAQLKRYLGEQVGKHPVASLGLGALLGFCLGQWQSAPLQKEPLKTSLAPAPSWFSTIAAELGKLLTPFLYNFATEHLSAVFKNNTNEGDFSRDSSVGRATDS